MAGYSDLLIDALRGASNAVASNVSAPVDAIAWGLNKAGVPVKEPVGGSDWMKRMGLTVEPGNRAAGLVGETIGNIAPMAIGAKAEQIASALRKGGENLATARTLHPEQGAVVWHGSPHQFDKFDSSKIGTGEGAQVYGHGIYVAESPDVARTYRETLSPAEFKVKGGGEYNPDNVQHWAAAELFDAQKAGKSNIDLAREMRARELSLRARKSEWAAIEADKLNAAWKQIATNPKSLPELEVNMGGALYKVDLPDERIAKMLDWDKPLSQQPAHVREFFESHVAPRRAVEAQPAGPEWGDLAAPRTYDPAGHELLSLLRQQSDNIDAQALLSGGGPALSERLRKAGVPGIRYLDASSRRTGVGTSNFVIFPGEENALRILRRN